jgi:hypothetical protein
LGRGNLLPWAVVFGAPPFVPRQDERMKYALLTCDTAQSEKAWEAMSDAERARAFAQVDRWFAEHAGNIAYSARLQSSRASWSTRRALS